MIRTFSGSLRMMLLVYIAAVIFTYTGNAQTYTAVLNGASENPANPSTATGQVTLTISGNQLLVNCSFSGLTGGNASAAHIHAATAPPGVAGVAIPLNGFPGATSGTYTNAFDLTNPSTYDAAYLTASGGTAAGAQAALVAAFNAGQCYINIHNATYPGGEIRGFFAYKLSSNTPSQTATTGTWTAPATGGPYLIKITAGGAQGGGNNIVAGGSGAVMSGSFIINAGQTINLTAGAPGGPGVAGGGGGGSGAYIQNNAIQNVLVIAGGGGGAGYGASSVSGNGQAGTSGGGGSSAAPSGSNGNGGTGCGTPAGAGGGLLTGSGCGGGGGFGFNGVGGTSGSGGAGGGGVGAGGGSGFYSTSIPIYAGGGGGGGYSGGGGGTNNGSSPGGTGSGGGSINNGTNQTNTAGANAGGGYVIIECLGLACVTDPIVINNNDAGPGSLRQAIIDACPGSTITFDMNQVVSPITLTSGQLVIDKNLTITAPGANVGSSRVDLQACKLEYSIVSPK